MSSLKVALAHHKISTTPTEMYDAVQKVWAIWKNNQGTVIESIEHDGELSQTPRAPCFFALKVVDDNSISVARTEIQGIIHEAMKNIMNVDKYYTITIE